MRSKKQLSLAVLAAGLLVCADRVHGDSTGYTTGFSDINAQGGSVSYNTSTGLFVADLYTWDVTLADGTVLPTDVTPLTSNGPTDMFVVTAHIASDGTVTDPSLNIAYNDGLGASAPDMFSLSSDSLVGKPQFIFPANSSEGVAFSFLFAGSAGQAIGVNILPSLETPDPNAPNAPMDVAATAQDKFMASFSYSGPTTADAGPVAVPLPKGLWQGITILGVLGLLGFGKRVSRRGIGSLEI